MVTYSVENAQVMHEKLKPVLDMPFKSWLLFQPHPQQESDHATILALRDLVKVSLLNLYS